MNIGFDNQKYLQMQSAHIRERISMFGDKLYLEFGGKLCLYGDAGALGQFICLRRARCV